MSSEIDITGMVRSGDHGTSVMAAESVAESMSELQQKVYSALKTYGPLTDEELESLPQFARFAYSTVRKRRTDLYQNGAVFKIGEKLNSRRRQMIVWGLKEHIPSRQLMLPL